MLNKQKTPQPKEPVALAISRSEATSRIEDRIVKGSKLMCTLVNTQESYESSKKEYRLWDDYNVEMLKRIFTADEISEEYSRWIGVAPISMHTPTLKEKIEDLNEDIDRMIDRLRSILGRLELIPVADEEAQQQGVSRVKPQKPSKKVFLVHGHNEVAKTTLEVFLSEIGIEPVVLHRQADEGLTIIEKFEKHSNVGYAFILLTPDEVAYLATDDSKPDSERNKEFRARPNVIFEFGYFVGMLGRSRTCCLYTGGVELPSDVSGMIYKKFNRSIEEVAYSIIKDLKAVGYELNVS